MPSYKSAAGKKVPDPESCVRIIKLNPNANETVIERDGFKPDEWRRVHEHAFHNPDEFKPEYDRVQVIASQVTKLYTESELKQKNLANLQHLASELKLNLDELETKKDYISAILDKQEQIQTAASAMAAE